MSESALPVNSMGSGANVATFDPFLKKTPVKRLRDIIGPSVKSEIKKDRSRGI